MCPTCSYCRSGLFVMPAFPVSAQKSPICKQIVDSPGGIKYNKAKPRSHKGENTMRPQLEKLDRGLVAVKTNDGVYLSCGFCGKRCAVQRKSV